MIKRGNWAPDTLNTGLRDHVMDEAASIVCVLYYRGRLGTTVNYKFIPTTFMLMGLLNSLAQALRRHSWISSFRTPSGKRQVVVVVIVVGPLPVL